MGVTVTVSSWFYYQGNALLAFASNSFHCDFLCCPSKTSRQWGAAAPGLLCPGKSSVKVIVGVVFKLGRISKWALLQMVLPAKSEVSKSSFQWHFWVLVKLLPFPRHRNLKRLYQKLQEYIVRTLGCCQENWAIFLSYFFTFSIS